jgi:polyphosphate kinase 2 (PPK2 family)
MIARNSTEFAPFHLVSGEDKRHARVTILQTLCERIENRL